MSDSDSFQHLICRLQAGDQDAASKIYSRFAEQLIRKARTRLNGGVRRKLDPDDVVQSVFNSFFLRQAQGQFELKDWDSLWGLLVRITLRKCGRHVAALHAQRRDARREVEPASSGMESCVPWEAIAREPTPEEVAMLTETQSCLMRRLDERQRQMVVMHLQGYTAPEISRQVGRSERTVQRLLAEVRAVLRKEEQRLAQ